MTFSYVLINFLFGRKNLTVTSSYKSMFLNVNNMSWDLVNISAQIIYTAHSLKQNTKHTNCTKTYPTEMFSLAPFKTFDSCRG